MLSACGITECWLPLLRDADHASLPSSSWMFEGVLKQQASDFIVAEVDPSGQSCALETAAEREQYHFSATIRSSSAAAGSTTTNLPSAAPLMVVAVDEQQLLKIVDDAFDKSTPLGAYWARLEKMMVQEEKQMEEPLDCLSMEEVSIFFGAIFSPALCRSFLADLPHSFSSPLVQPVLLTMGIPFPDGAAAAPAACSGERWALSKSTRRELHAHFQAHFPFLTLTLSENPIDRSLSTLPLTLTVQFDLGLLYCGFLLGAEAMHWLSHRRSSSRQIDTAEELPSLTQSAALPTKYEARVRDAHGVWSGWATACAAMEEGGGGENPSKWLRRGLHEVLRRKFPRVSCRVANGRAQLLWRGGGGGCREQRGGGVKRPRMLETMDETHGSTTAAPILTCAAQDTNPLLYILPCASPDVSLANQTSTSAARATHDESGAVSFAPPPPSFTRRFLYAIVKKINIETATMKERLGNFWNVPPQSISAAGMKDRRALTFQRVSFPRLVDCSSSSKEQPQPQQLVGTVPIGDEVGSLEVVAVSFPHHFDQPIAIGELRGNQFSIRVRGVHQVGDPEGPTTGETRTTRCLSWREELQQRTRIVAQWGCINYFGQQRFSESVMSLRDHTGVKLWCGFWTEAVESLYRSAPELVAEFPEKMNPKYAPSNSRDMQAMSAALYHTHKLYFQGPGKKVGLVPTDVQGRTSKWEQLCEAALTSLPYAVRSMWIHAAQSVLFNQTASLMVDRFRRFIQCKSSSFSATAADLKEEREGLARWLMRLYIPLGGSLEEWGVEKVFECVEAPANGYTEQELQYQRLCYDWLMASLEDAIEKIGFVGEGREKAHPGGNAVDPGGKEGSSATDTLAPPASAIRQRFFGRKKVCGVPIAATRRKLIVVPSEMKLEWKESSVASKAEAENEVSPGEWDACFKFFLPSSSYATILLREVFNRDGRW